MLDLIMHACDTNTQNGEVGSSKPLSATLCVESHLVTGASAERWKVGGAQICGLQQHTYVITALRNFRQEDQEFEASLGE